MTEKLKYKVGDKVLVEAEVTQVDGSKFPYRVESVDTFLTWFSEDELDKSIINLPQKPKIPQAVMDWYEENENERADWRISDWLNDTYTLEGMDDWLYGENNLHNQHAIATLIAYGLEAVEVEREKLYKVMVKKVATGNNYLIKNEDVGHFVFGGDRQLDGYTYSFTKQELIDAGFEGVFDNPMFEVEEVE